MLTALLGLASGITWGVSDFCAGLAARRAPLLPMVLVTQVGSLIVALGLALFPLAVADVGWQPLAWGAASGLVGEIGIILLYWALAVAPMAVAGPLTALAAIIVPFIGGLVLGQIPTVLASGGVGLAMMAILMIAGGNGAAQAQENTRWDRRVALLAIGAGLGIGLAYIGLERAGRDAGFWPLVAARVASILLILAPALWRGPPRLGPAAISLALGCGVADGLGMAFYMLALRQGLLGVVAALVSLYPAATILLAWLVLGETIGRRQAAGLGVAAVAVVMIAAG